MEIPTKALAFEFSKENEPDNRIKILLWMEKCVTSLENRIASEMSGGKMIMEKHLC